MSCLLVGCLLTTSLDGLTGVEEGEDRDGAGPADGPDRDASVDDSTPEGSSFVDSGDDATDARVDVALPDAGADADAVAPPVSYREVVLSDGPLAYWRLGEASGTVAADQTGRRPATYTNSTGYRMAAAGALSGDPDRALELLGTTGRVVVGDVFDFVAQPFSLEVWLKVPSAPSEWVRVLSKEVFAPARQGYHIEITPALKLEFGFHRDDNSEWLTSQLSAGVYTHVVITNDRTSLRCFHDGALVDTSPSTLDLLDNVAKLTIGCDSEGDACFAGMVDEVAIYGKALSAVRVKAHYDVGRRR